MPKYLDLSAHHEVTLDELLGKKPPKPIPDKKVKPTQPTPKEKEVKTE